MARTAVVSAIRCVYVAMLLARTQIFAQTWPKVGNWWAFDVADEGNVKRTAYESTRKIGAIEGGLFAIKITPLANGVDCKFRKTRDQDLNIMESGWIR